MLQLQRSSQVTFLQASELEVIPGVVHGFSTRRGTTDNFKMAPDAPDVRENQERFKAAIGTPGWPTFLLHQVHSNVVHALKDNASANEKPQGDAAFTGIPGVMVGVTTADCVPILIADSQAQCVAAVHAGWRGTSEGVTPRAVQGMIEDHGLDPTRLQIVIGPHIGVCCLEVGEEVYDWFGQPEVFERRPEWDKPHLNLAEANRLQLAGVGVKLERIITSSLCTRCRSDLFYSYRRDGDGVGHMLSVIGIEP